METMEQIAAAVGDAARFVRLTLSAPARADEAEWLKATIRPVETAGGGLQAVLQGRRKQVAQSFSSEEAAGKLDELLAMGFRNLHLQCTDGDLHVRFTRKGKAMVSRGKPSVAEAPSRAHDRVKEHPLPASEADEFLERAGITRDGRVLPAMRDKFRQINQFISLLEHTPLLREATPGAALHMVDFGCGRALLTFAAYHYFRDRKGLNIGLTGVDADEAVVRSAETLRARLGYDAVRLVRARIAEYQPDPPPDVVLSLHACDTATDEAIAQGVRCGARLIICVPCCQHELHHSLDRPEMRAALRHGILRERMADIATDALRAAALRVMGYKAEVIEFVAQDATAKNVMIRAERVGAAAIAGSVEEYLALRDFWAVLPAIEKMLGADFASRLRTD